MTQVLVTLAGVKAPIKGLTEIPNILSGSTIAFSTDGKLCVAATLEASGYRIRCADVDSRTWRSESLHSEDRVVNILFYPGETVAVIATEKRIFSWDVITDAKDEIYSAGHYTVCGLAISGDGKVLAIGRWFGERV